MFPLHHGSPSVESISVWIQDGVASKSSQHQAVISFVSATQHHPPRFRPDSVVCLDIVITSRVVSVRVYGVAPSSTPQITQPQTIVKYACWWVLVPLQVVIIEVGKIHHQFFPVSVTIQPLVLTTSPSTVWLVVMPAQPHVGSSAVTGVRRVQTDMTVWCKTNGPSLDMVPVSPPLPISLPSSATSHPAHVCKCSQPNCATVSLAARQHPPDIVVGWPHVTCAVPCGLSILMSDVILPSLQQQVGHVDLVIPHR